MYTPGVLAEIVDRGYVDVGFTRGGQYLGNTYAALAVADILKEAAGSLNKINIGDVEAKIRSRGSYSGLTTISFIVKNKQNTDSF